MIVEMAGKPAEHVKEKLTEHVGILKQVKDLKVHSIKVSDPKELEKHPGIFTCFAETEFEAPNLSRVTETMFDFMPSSVEIMEPSKVTMDANEATSMLNNITGRLHRYDDIAKLAKNRYHTLAMQFLEQKKELDKLKKQEGKEDTIKEKEVLDKKTEDILDNSGPLEKKKSSKKKK